MTQRSETLGEFWRNLALAFTIAGIVYLLGTLVAVALLF